MVHANLGHTYFIRAYHGCYDPLSYPVFYPEVRPVGRRKRYCWKTLQLCVFQGRRENIPSIKNQVYAPSFCDPIKNGLNVICNCWLPSMCDHVKITIGNR